MDTILGQLKSLALKVWQQAKVRKGLTRTIVVLLVLQLYFVRELIAAEALFALFFVAVMAVVGICYALGSIGLKSIDATEVGARVAAQSARRSYDMLEMVARNSIRHLPSETAK